MDSIPQGTSTPQTTIEGFLHGFRQQIDACIKIAEQSQTEPIPDSSKSFAREMALVRTKLQEAKMWVGKCLEVHGVPFPQELRDEAK